MFQFSDNEIDLLRKKDGHDAIVALLEKETEQFRSHELLIPETGCANWSHYYFCPDCSVQLVFDLDSPTDHVCPSCGKHFSDVEKNGAWWRLVNTFNENACYHLGLLYMLTGKEEYARSVSSVLLGYARYYPGYEVHGDIPYNGPGRLNAQTLDESNFLRNMAYAYDLVETALTGEERDYIKTRLFSVGIEFLKKNRHDQIHNHEVICNGAIGVLALILDDRESLDFALNGKYGLVYQLEHGVLEDGFWFECSTAYHFYALQNFLLYEKFARHTAYSHLSHPNYVAMIRSALRMQKSDMSFPLLNDCHINQGSPDGYSLFEFAYSNWRIDELVPVLSSIYARKPRLSIESYFYGVDKLPPSVPDAAEKKSVEGESGLGCTIIRRGDAYLLFRHGPYGGEHDHYDRLGISYYYDNVPVSIDVGTTGYGAKLHYAYYKNTVTHNTVAINGQNQSPSRGTLVSFSEDDASSDVSAYVRWEDGYRMPDSFTIRQWDDEAYAGACMTRSIKVTDKAIIDSFSVVLPEDRTIDYFLHFHGERLSEGDAQPCREAFASDGPLSYLHDVLSCPEGKVLHTSYSNMGIVTDVFSFSPDSSVFLASGPDNPSSSDMSYLIMENRARSASFVTVLSSGKGESPLSDAHLEMEDGRYRVILITKDGKKESYLV